MIALEYGVSADAVAADEFAHREIVRRFNECVAATDTEQLDPARFIDPIVSLLEDCIRLPWIVDSRLAGELALLVARGWLWDTGHALLLRPAEREAVLTTLALLAFAPTRTLRDDTRRALGRNIVERATLRCLGTRDDVAPLKVDGPALVILSSPMNDVAPDHLDELADHLMVFAWLWESRGVASFAPALLRDPRLPGDMSNRLGLLNVDEVMMSIASLTVLYTYPYSSGVGVMSRVAVEHNVPVVLVNGRGSVPLAQDEAGRVTGDDTTASVPTTMVRDSRNGVCAQITRGFDRATVWAEYAELVARDIDAVEMRCARVRATHADATRQRDAWIATVEAMSAHELTSIPPVDHLVSKATLHFTLAHPLLFTRAVGAMKIALETILPPVSVPLEPDQLAALHSARADFDWTDAQVRLLVAIARRILTRHPMAATSHLRKATSTGEWWKTLYARAAS